jgi:PST family polysaccharide transporter
MVLTSAFGFYLLPTFSKLYTKYLRKEIFSIWKITLPTTIIAGVGLFFLKDFVIRLVFTEEFLVISSLMGFQILGDVLKINSWVLGNLILAKAHTKVFIGVQVGWAVLFFLLSLVFLNIYGFWGISVAYFLTYLVHFIFMNIYFKKLLWQKL